MIRLWCPGWRDTWECPVFRAFFFRMLFLWVSYRVELEGFFRLASVSCFLPEFFSYRLPILGLGI